MSFDKVAIPSLAPVSSPVLPSFSSIPSPKISTIPKPAKPVKIPSIVKNPSINKLNIEIIEEAKDKNLHDLTAHNIENELSRAGYVVFNKIVVRFENGSKKLQFVKAANNKGQKVYILVDVTSYMSVHANDLIIRENSASNCIPYSYKNGIYNSAVKDVTGVAFEYGSNSICTLILNPDDLNVKETNYTINEKDFCDEKHYHIVAYPIIRLTEIKINPKIILDNTNVVINRIRNNETLYERNELEAQKQSIINLENAFNDIANLFDDVADKLESNFKQLEDWKEIYIKDPPDEDEYKERFVKLQLKLIKRNEDAINLIHIMKQVAEERKKIDAITHNIEEYIRFCQKEFFELM